MFFDMLYWRVLMGLKSSVYELSSFWLLALQLPCRQVQAMPRGSEMKKRRCDHCRGLIAKNARTDARYCSRTCQSVAYRQAQRGEAQDEPKIPKEIAALEVLLASTPQAAVWYALGIALDDQPMLTFFPPASRRSKRFNGAFSTVPFFRLRPFEPPRVPIVGRYAVRIFDGAGRQLPTPAALSMGVDVAVCIRGNTPRIW